MPALLQKSCQAAPDSAPEDGPAAEARARPHGARAALDGIHAHSRSIGARPFVKWVGGKRQLLDVILRHLPSRFRTFHEPFLGGGAVFFGLQPAQAVLGDRNERLVRAYRAIRTSVEDVIAALARLSNHRDVFYEVRAWDVDSLPDHQVAAWLIYLNKTGFNGLYRVNRRNLFNVPFGDNPKATICDAENLRACSAALGNAEIVSGDFARVLERAKEGDLVYFDPPYAAGPSGSFTSYTAGGFGWPDQVRLRDVALELRRRGVFVLLSNAGTDAVRELYAPDFSCIPVAARRAVNSVGSGRGEVTEFLIS